MNKQRRHATTNAKSRVAYIQAFPTYNHTLFSAVPLPPFPPASLAAAPWCCSAVVHAGAAYAFGDMSHPARMRATSEERERGENNQKYGKIKNQATQGGSGSLSIYHCCRYSATQLVLVSIISLRVDQIENWEVRITDCAKTLIMLDRIRIIACHAATDESFVRLTV